MMSLRSCCSLVVLGLLVGCKVQIDVSDRGRVDTQSGAYSCGPGETCVVDVNDALFDETFVGQPRGEYVFARWVKKDLSFCGGSSNSCRLTTRGFDAFPVLMQVIESDQVFYLEPAFEPADQPWSTSGTYGFETDAMQLKCQDGSRVRIAARSERVRITEVGYKMRVEFLDEQAIGGLAGAETYDAFGTVAGNGRFNLARIGQVPKAGSGEDSLAEETLQLSGSISQTGWQGFFSTTVVYPEGDLKICTGGGRFRGEKRSDRVAAIDTARLPDLQGVYRIAVSAQDLECDNFADTEAVPLDGVSLSVAFEQSADLVSNNLLSLIDPGDTLEILQVRPLAGWVEEDFFGTLTAVTARAPGFDAGFTLLVLFYGEVDGERLSGAIEVERQIRSEPFSRSCFDEFRFTGSRVGDLP